MATPDLRVPTIPVDAEVRLAGGEKLSGRIYLPPALAGHGGPPRVEEWLNAKEAFFPFECQGGEGFLILNKDEILAVTVTASANLLPLPEDVEIPERRITVSVEGTPITGLLAVDMPKEHLRVLDVLNRAGDFLTLRDGDSHHLVQKRRITRVLEATTP
jgi:hypothetical protein